MSGLDKIFEDAGSLEPDDRIRLIARLWASLPSDHWAAPSAGELAEISRRLGDHDANRIDDAPWDVVRRMLFPESHQPSPKLYGARRRFDLATIFVAMAMYSVLFAGMNLLGSPPLVSLYFGILIAIVGVGQALLESVVDARRASIIVGACVHTVLSLALMAVYSRIFSIDSAFSLPSLFLVIVVNGLILGGAMGYMAGVLVGGIFLVADALRGRYGKSDDEVVNHGAVVAQHPLDGPVVSQP